MLAPPAEFHLERLRRPALEAPNPHAEGSRLWILLEESKAEHTPLSEDRPYVPLSVYQSSDIVANSTGRALLARAVETNRRDVVQFLLSRGLDVNDEYMGLLHASVWAGQWFATVLLLDCGADVDVRATDRRRTPLMRAADRTRSVRAEAMPAHLAMVRLLLSRGADVRAKDRMGHQAHQIAAMGTPVRALLSDVRAAGGWRSYVHRDRMRLLVLRALCEKGRATTSDGLLARLFAAKKVAPARPSSKADDAGRTVFRGNLPIRPSDVPARVSRECEILPHGPGTASDATVDATARLLSDLDACMQFEEDYYEGRLDSVLPKSWLKMDKDLAFDTVDVVVKAEPAFGIYFKNVDERCVVRGFVDNVDAVDKLRCNDVLIAVGDVEARAVGFKATLEELGNCASAGAATLRVARPRLPPHLVYDATIISAAPAPAPAAARLDQDVFKKIFSFWEPLGHDMWLDLSRDSVRLDRYCRSSQVCTRMLIPHVEYD